MAESAKAAKSLQWLLKQEMDEGIRYGQSSNIRDGNRPPFPFQVRK